MDNRTALLNVALELFADRGYDAVGVQEIVTAAGVTKPTLYHYFGSKTALLETLVAEQSAPLAAALEAAARYAGDLPLTLHRIVTAYFEFAAARPTFYRLHLALWFAPARNEARQIAVAFHERLYRMIEDVFARAAADHGNMRGRHHAYAATLIGMINTYVGLHLQGNFDLDQAVARQAVHQFSHGIYS
ncbi:MAG TPA: TetR/AcrR family transcriptional regulator [Herpetosiphonaceae bacterium]|nr:TetR/AcrR family transcriptional regulator [Herpetosiphonaceae bacterium]